MQEIEIGDRVIVHCDGWDREWLGKVVDIFSHRYGKEYSVEYGKDRDPVRWRFSEANPVCVDGYIPRTYIRNLTKEEENDRALPWEHLT